MTITYYTKHVYGKELCYLANKSQSQLWYALTEKKTITQYEMENLVDLAGVTFERVFEPVAAV
jgi:hypothetical protein